MSGFLLGGGISQVTHSLEKREEKMGSTEEGVNHDKDVPTSCLVQSFAVFVTVLRKSEMLSKTPNRERYHAVKFNKRG